MFAKSPGSSRKITRKLKVNVVTYIIPFDDKVSTGVPLWTNLTKDMIKETVVHELESPFKLTELSQTVAQYNSRQVTMSKKLKKKTIYHKRITKNLNS